jgi:hypothetical protein
MELKAEPAEELKAAVIPPYGMIPMDAKCTVELVKNIPIKFRDSIIIDKIKYVIYSMDNRTNEIINSITPLLTDNQASEIADGVYCYIIGLKPDESIHIWYKRVISFNEIQTTHLNIMQELCNRHEITHYIYAGEFIKHRGNEESVREPVKRHRDDSDDLPLEKQYKTLKGKNKITSVDSKITSVDSKITSVDSKITSVDSKITSVDSTIDVNFLSGTYMLFKIEPEAPTPEQEIFVTYIFADTFPESRIHIDKNKISFIKKTSPYTNMTKEKLSLYISADAAIYRFDTKNPEEKDRYDELVELLKPESRQPTKRDFIEHFGRYLLTHETALGLLKQPWNKTYKKRRHRRNRTRERTRSKNRLSKHKSRLHTRTRKV